MLGQEVEVSPIGTPALLSPPCPVLSSSHHTPRKPWETTAVNHLSLEKMPSNSPEVAQGHLTGLHLHYGL